MSKYNSVVGKYYLFIQESQPVDSTLVTLRASPGDDIRYQALGTPDQWRFFSVDQSSGNFSVARPLSEDTSNRQTYSLSVRATRPSDGQTADGQIIVSVIRNLHAPRFINQPYRTSIGIDSKISKCHNFPTSC